MIPLLCKDCCGYLGSSCFHTNFRILCSSPVKNAIGNLMGIAVNLQTALVKYRHFNSINSSSP